MCGFYICSKGYIFCILDPDRATIVAPSSSVFDSVSYTAMTQEIPEGRPARPPDYDEILDQESSSSDANNHLTHRDKLNVHLDLNHQRGTPQLPGNYVDNVSDLCGSIHSPTKRLMNDK